MIDTPAAGKTLVTLQFLGMGVVWGSSFLFMKVALNGVGFGQIAWSRLVLGGLTLGLIVLLTRPRVARGTVLPREGVVWLHFLVIAITGCVVPHLLFAWAEQYVSSSLASIYNAVTPIMTAVMATLAFRVERLARGQVVGVAVGILGVLMIIGPWRYQELTGDLWGQLACLGAAVCYGFTFGYTRRFLSGRPIAGATFAFLNIGIAGAIMLVLTPVLAWQPVALTWPIVLSLAALGTLGTGVAYIWNINVLRAWGPTNASTVTYVTPVVGVLLGVLVLAETLSWNEPVGAALVLVGILLTQKRMPAALFRRDRAAPPRSTLPVETDRRTGRSRPEGSTSAVKSRPRYRLTMAAHEESPAEAGQDAIEDLIGIRRSIDNIDAALIHLLAERFKFTQQVGRLKAASGMPASDAEREKVQIGRLRALAEESHLDPAFAEKFLNFIVAEVIHHHEQIAGGEALPGSAAAPSVAP